MRIIGLAGKAGSGKTHLAKEILAPRGYLPLALAGPMKAELMAQGVIPLEEALGVIGKSDRSRRVLQVYGTELGRERYHQDVWCEQLTWWMMWFNTHGYERFVIGDVRFENEVDWVRDGGGLVVRVVGRGGLVGAAAEHPSETALDHISAPHVDNSPDRDFFDVTADLIGLIEEYYKEEDDDDSR